MSIDAVFIPCAGFGTRMGELGKIIPKPLWTVAGISLLELKIFQFQKLGFNKFILNSHHQAEKIKAFAKASSLDILISEEPKILGNGGSFHKIQREKKSIKRVLVTNPDSFYFLESTDWDDFIKIANQEANVLLGVTCKKSDSYNRLSLVDSNVFSGVEIFGKDKITSDQTYGGMGIIDLESFQNKEGESSFFDSVINPVFNKTKVYSPKAHYEFWDFGTLSEFKEILENLKKGDAGKMGELLAEFYNDKSLERDTILKELEKNEVHDKYGEGQSYKIN